MKQSNDIKAILGIINSKIQDHQKTNQQCIQSIKETMKGKYPNLGQALVYLNHYQLHEKMIKELDFLSKQIQAYASETRRRKRKK